jgi:molecular chaperone GrpE (heat shock protein)
MADNEAKQDKEGQSGGRRFRLPKLFADADDPGEQQQDLSAAEKVAQKAQALGISLPAPVDDDVIAAANRPFEGSPRASVLPADAVQSSAGLRGSQTPSPSIQPESTSLGSSLTEIVPGYPNVEDNVLETGVNRDSSGSVAGSPLPDSALSASPLTDLPSAQASEEPNAPVPGRKQGGRRPVPTPVPAPVESVDPDLELMQEFLEMRTQIDTIANVMHELNERGLAQDKIFDTLHHELQDYKNDFIYEHLKPMVRPLLFLHDSIEQFEVELLSIEQQVPSERRQVLSPSIVRENIQFLRDQLTEALRICEVLPMATPEGQFDPRLHKAVDVVETDASQENIIQRVVRSGWYLNGRVFRPAEVVIGKKVNK